MERILYLTDAFCAVEENGRLVEYIPVNPSDHTGEIRMGRVERIMASMQCAFVDIGRTRSGFLPLHENSESFRGKEVRSGDRVMVQIRREEHDGKGAFLSRDVTLAGSAMLLMPMNRFVGVSARIRDPEDRKQLKEIGQSLCTGGDVPYGIVMRAAALGMNPETLKEERDLLWERWETANRKAAGHPENPVILAGNTAAEELIGDYGPRGIDRIEHSGNLTADLLRQLKESGERKIRLPHGGNIVIDPCEAMTVIDVNSASDGRNGSRRETILETNLEACREIAIQARIRNISGIIIIDLIDMEEPTDQSLVLEELQKSFAADRIKTVIHGLTRLGLVEITRKRSRNTVRQPE